MPSLAAPRPFTAVDTLGAIDPGVLVELLLPHSTWLAHHGCTLPAVTTATGLDLPRLAAALRQVDADYPEALIEALATIAETGVPDQVLAMQRAATRARPEILLPALDTLAPIDLAARIYLARPDLLKRVHAEAQIPAVRRFECWRVAEEIIPSFSFPADDDPALARLASQINAALTARLCGGNVRIYPCQAGHLAYFIIIHGATVQRVTTFQDDGSTGVEVFRPAVVDVLRYDPRAGELGIHLEKSSRWLAEAYRTTFGVCLFNRPHLFSGQRAFTLLPLCQHGRQALDCAAHPAFEEVLLTEVETTISEHRRFRITQNADDLFAALAEQGQTLSPTQAPSAAKLRFRLSAGGTRTATLRVPNVAIYQRVGDDDSIAAFLQERGFMLAEGADDAVA